MGIGVGRFEVDQVSRVAEEDLHFISENCHSRAPPCLGWFLDKYFFEISNGLGNGGRRIGKRFYMSSIRILRDWYRNVKQSL